MGFEDFDQAAEDQSQEPEPDPDSETSTDGSTTITENDEPTSVDQPEADDPVDPYEESVFPFV